MERWSGKIAVVTGASSGMGAATAVELVKAGLIVVGLARRVNRVEELKNNLPESLRSNLHPIECDVSKEDQIVKTFEFIEEKFGGVDVLINNAGISRSTNLIDSTNSKPIRDVIDTNVLGLVFCTREAVQSMQKRDFAGHIIHINSVTGHQVPYIAMPKFSFNIYPATKHAVTALTETLRQDLNKMKSKIRVTVSLKIRYVSQNTYKNSILLWFQSISPGGVATEMIPEELYKAREKGLVEFNLLEPVDIAESILYILGTPPRVQVCYLI